MCELMFPPPKKVPFKRNINEDLLTKRQEYNKKITNEPNFSTFQYLAIRNWYTV